MLKFGTIKDTRMSYLPREDSPAIEVISEAIELAKVSESKHIEVHFKNIVVDVTAASMPEAVYKHYLLQRIG